jgi:hypothetical protein
LGYLGSIAAGAAVTGRGLPPSARVRLPFVYATMHGSWAVGFLTGARSGEETTPREVAQAPPAP